MADDGILREHLRKLLSWEDAHVGFEAALAGLPMALRGTRPPGAPHSVWELVEHLRVAQHDILDFCVNPGYRVLTWPDDYWPRSPTPPSEEAWDASMRGYLGDLESLRQLAADASIDLGARIPHGSGQTYLRELLLVADHTAYHVGQIVIVRRLLGQWPAH
jgi:hypothetical protein